MCTTAAVLFIFINNRSRNLQEKREQYVVNNIAIHKWCLLSLILLPKNINCVVVSHSLSAQYIIQINYLFNSVLHHSSAAFRAGFPVPVSGICDV